MVLKPKITSESCSSHQTKQSHHHQGWDTSTASCQLTAGRKPCHPKGLSVRCRCIPDASLQVEEAAKLTSVSEESGKMRMLNVWHICCIQSAQSTKIQVTFSFMQVDPWDVESSVHPGSLSDTGGHSHQVREAPREGTLGSHSLKPSLGPFHACPVLVCDSNLH